MDGANYRSFFENVTGRRPYDYQETVASHLFDGKNIVLRAPTGAGKTLSALVPFLSDCWNAKPARLIYALPLRTLAQGIFEEAEEIARRLSLATSSVGKSLVVPTPYVIKMAFVDAAFRIGMPDDDCARLLKSFISVEVRISPPDAACATHTFVKVRQEPHDRKKAAEPYISSIAYREVVHHSGVWRWAFDLASLDDQTGCRLATLAPYVTYVGKRGSFVQYLSASRLRELDGSFTQTVPTGTDWTMPTGGAHIVPLDDFGPEADLQTLSSFTDRPAKRDKHRKFVRTIVPLGIVNAGPGFTEYRK